MIRSIFRIGVCITINVFHTFTLLLYSCIELDILMGRTAPAANTNNNTNHNGAMFPPLNVKGANLHLIEPRKPSDLPLADIQKVRFSYSFLQYVVLSYVLGRSTN